MSLTRNLIWIAAFAMITSALAQSRYNCTEEDRAVEQCTQDYLPVCGWFNANTACLVYPCAITTGNNCAACQDKTVEYVTPGECPKSYNDTDNDLEQITLLSLSQASNSTMCKQEDRGKICTQDWIPVCGYWGCPEEVICTKEYGNTCQACAAENVEFVVETTCSAFESYLDIFSSNDDSSGFLYVAFLLSWFLIILV